MKLEIDLTGYEKLMSKLDPMELEELLDAIEMEITETQQIVFGESQLEVPVDTGLLKNSGKPDPVERDADGIEARITYNTDYALWVHERVELRHNGMTKAKYLEDPMKAQARPFSENLKDIIETYFGGDTE